MKTININGKEYTESQFTKLAALKQAFVTYPEIAYGDVLIEAFEDLRDEFPRAEPSPPKLRPMSELPEHKRNVLFSLGRIHDRENRDLWTFKTGYLTSESVRPCAYIGNSQFDKADNWESYSDGGQYLLGWLPLPNANEIEL